eukprot:s835_g15.t1
MPDVYPIILSIFYGNNTTLPDGQHFHLNHGRFRWDPERQLHHVLSASHREVLCFRAVRLWRKKRRPGESPAENLANSDASILGWRSLHKHPFGADGDAVRLCAKRVQQRQNSEKEHRQLEGKQNTKEAAAQRQKWQKSGTSGRQGKSVCAQDSAKTEAEDN